MFRMQNYIIIIINLYNFLIIKKLRKDRQAYICRICYINLLIYHFWLSSLVPVDSSHHLLTLFNSSVTLLPPTFFVLHFYWQMYCISMCYRFSNTILWIYPFTIAFKSIKRRWEKKYALILSHNCTVTFTTAICFFMWIQITILDHRQFLFPVFSSFA